VPAKLRHLLVTLALPLTLAACDGSNGTGSSGFTLQGCADTGTCASNPTLVLGGDRPAMVQIPSNYDNSSRYPLIMVLHGRGVTGYIQSIYFELFDKVDSRQFVLIYPDGLVATDGRRQWRSTPTCCDTSREEADAISDVGYLSDLIQEAADTYSIDPSRIGLIGHSSGGFMSFTMACEASHLVTSIVNLAGSTFVDLDRCRPATERVSVLSIHGDLDDTVFYDGLEGGYLSAPAAAERYAMLAGCDTGAPTAGPDVDLVTSLPGAETSTTSWPGCLQGSEVEFWKMNDGPHIPGPWVDAGLDAFVDWMLDHPRD
jgi:polyhydroxybutyrate depolymerase